MYDVLFYEFDGAGVFFCFLIIVDADEDDISSIVGQSIVVTIGFYLFESRLSRLIIFQFEDDSGR